MIVDDGTCLRIQGALTMQTVANILETGRAFCRRNDCRRSRLIDLSAVGRVDSAALALLMDWIRTAQESGQALQLQGASEQLQLLAALYGVDDLLPLDTANSGIAPQEL